jgi:steroid 5-alpha reductase family enzyme
MSLLLSPLLTGLAAILGAALLVWFVSLYKRDVSIVDIFWGLGFIGLTWLYHSFGPEAGLRQLLLLLLVTVWGLRLSLYLLWRNWGEGEDRRYRAMRDAHGERFWWVSLFTIFFLQAGLIWFIALPLFVVQTCSTPLAWRWTDTVGLLLWSVGFLFETVGDWQLARFKADPRNREQVMCTGLWAYTRHPNYFGDALVWWGYFFLALATPEGIWTVGSPVLMTFLLLRISGVALLEQTISERRPAYRDYIERTSAFFPWFPKRKVT